MPPLPSKKDVLLGLLEKTSVLVHLDARRDGVSVPRHLAANPQLILQLGLNLAVPIRDLEVGDDDVRCTLSFSRTPFYCVLPYPAIFAMVSEDGGQAMVWPEDVPVEVARAAEAEARRRSTDAPEPEPLKAAPKRRLAEAKAGEPKRAAKSKPAAAKAEKAAPAKKPLPPYLRVVK